MLLGNITSSIARAKAIKGSVQKVNLVARMVVGMDVGDALYQLKFCKKRAARDLYPVLNSAIANAENNYNLNIDDLYIKEIKVGRAFALRRYRARARGRAGKISKPYSNVEVIVSEKGGEHGSKS